MDEAAIIDKIILFGIGRQEAIVYICLLRNGSMTGYEVSKSTGISRSNVYNALAALVEHGGAYISEGNPTKYLPVNLEEFCNNRIHYLGEIKEVLIKEGPRKEAITEGYITITGYQHIWNKVHHMLLNARKRIYFSASADIIVLWKDDIIKLLEKKIKVALISDKVPQGFIEGDAICGGILFYQSIHPHKHWEEYGKQLRLIVDSTLVLTGEVNGETADTCLYSSQGNFVNVFKEALNNEIKLIELSIENDFEEE